MKLKQMPYWMRGGLLLGIPAFVLTGLFAYSEYQGCSPGWTSMCGTGLSLISMFWGLGAPLLIAIPLVGSLGKILALGKDGEYVLFAILVSIGFFIEYFLVGALIGWISQKITPRKRRILLGVVIGSLIWIIVVFGGFTEGRVNIFTSFMNSSFTVLIFALIGGIAGALLRTS